MRDGPRCAFEVGADVLAKRRAPLVRVTTRGGRAVLVEHVNFAGIDDGDDFARAEIERDDKGELANVKKYDRFGAIVQWQKWSENGARVDFVDVDGKTPRRSDGRITTTKYEYDDLGRVKKKRHYGPTGHPRADEEGAYGEAFEWSDVPGVWSTMTYLGADGNPAPTTTGIASYHRKNDGTPWSDYSVFDVHGKPAMRKGSHIEKRPHDAIEETGQAFFGLKGEAIKNTRSGVPRAPHRVGPGKHAADWIIYDEHGKPQPVTRFVDLGSSPHVRRSRAARARGDARRPGQPRDQHERLVRAQDDVRRQGPPDRPRAARSVARAHPDDLRLRQARAEARRARQPARGALLRRRGQADALERGRGDRARDVRRARSAPHARELRRERQADRDDARLRERAHEVRSHAQSHRDSPSSTPRTSRRSATTGSRSSAGRTTTTTTSSQSRTSTRRARPRRSNRSTRRASS